MKVATALLIVFSLTTAKAEIAGTSGMNLTPGDASGIRMLNQSVESAPWELAAYRNHGSGDDGI